MVSRIGGWGLGRQRSTEGEVERKGNKSRKGR